PWNEPLHLDAAGEARLAVVQLAREGIDHQGVLRERDAAVQRPGGDGQAAKAAGAVFDAGVAEHGGVLQRAADRRLDQVRPRSMLDVREQAGKYPPVDARAEPQIELAVASAPAGEMRGGERRAQRETLGPDSLRPAGELGRPVVLECP